MKTGIFARIGVFRRLCIPEADEASVLTKVKEEMAEFIAEPCLEEAADVVIALLLWADLRGEDLHKAIHHKMDTNEARTWELQEDGSYHHV